MDDEGMLVVAEALKENTTARHVDLVGLTWWGAVACRPVPWHAVQCRAMPCNAVPWRAVMCRAVPCHGVPWRAVAWCCVPWAVWLRVDYVALAFVLGSGWGFHLSGAQWQKSSAAQHPPAHQWLGRSTISTMFAMFQAASPAHVLTRPCVFFFLCTIIYLFQPPTRSTTR